MTIILYTLDSIVRGLIFVIFCALIVIATIVVQELWDILSQDRIYELECQKCGELFCSTSRHVIHEWTEASDECLGKGKIIGSYPV